MGGNITEEGNYWDGSAQTNIDGICGLGGSLGAQTLQELSRKGSL